MATGTDGREDLERAGGERSLSALFQAAPGTARGGGARRRAVRLALALALVGGALALAVIGVRRWGPGAPPHEAAELDTAHYLRPIEAAADPSTGEATAPFSGFAVSIETDPPDALVSVAGVERGESPVLAGVECKPGASVSIRAEKAGFRPARTTTTCRLDSLVKLTLRLRR